MTTIPDYKSVSFQGLRELAHEHARLTYEKEYPLAQGCLEKLGGFRSSLGTRVYELQNEKVTIPTKEELLVEEQENLTAYWYYREIAHKTNELARGFSSIVVYLTPQPRLYADEESLKNEAPEYLRSFNACDELSRKYMSEVSNWHGKVDTLQTKMFELLNREVCYTLQRFCQIVANDGKPLGKFTTLIDYCTTPFIAKPQSKESKEIPLESVLNDESKASQTGNKELDNIASNESTTTATTTASNEEKRENVDPPIGEKKLAEGDNVDSGAPTNNEEKAATTTASNEEKSENVDSPIGEKKLAEGDNVDSVTPTNNGENAVDLSSSTILS